MLLTRPLFTKGSFFGSLISRVRPSPIASISLSTPLDEAASASKVSHKPKTVEEKVGLPPRPKKPLTPYFRFMREMRPKVLQKNPDLNAMDVVRAITKQWETAETSIKDRLLDEYRRDHQLYVELRTKYDSQITDQQRAEIKQIKQEVAESKERRLMRKRVKLLGRPKKPASAFLQFLSQERKKTPQQSHETFREWHKKATAKWTRLSEAEKEPFVNASRKELEQYKKAMEEWEKQMIRLGNIDVVRFGSLIDPPEPKPKKR